MWSHVAPQAYAAAGPACDRRQAEGAVGELLAAAREPQAGLEAAVAVRALPGRGRRASGTGRTRARGGLRAGDLLADRAVLGLARLADAVDPGRACSGSRTRSDRPDDARADGVRASGAVERTGQAARASRSSRRRARARRRTAHCGSCTDGAPSRRRRAAQPRALAVAAVQAQRRRAGTAAARRRAGCRAAPSRPSARGRGGCRSASGRDGPPGTAGDRAAASTACRAGTAGRGTAGGWARSRPTSSSIRGPNWRPTAVMKRRKRVGLGK